MATHQGEGGGQGHGDPNGGPDSYRQPAGIVGGEGYGGGGEGFGGGPGEGVDRGYGGGAGEGGDRGYREAAQGAFQGGDGDGPDARNQRPGFKLFIGGIPFKWDDTDLRNYFLKYGNITFSKVPCVCPVRDTCRHFVHVVRICIGVVRAFTPCCTKRPY
jgi:hypothetical protein